MTEAAAKIERLRAWLDRAGRAAVVLTGHGPVAWATAGLTDPIERGAPIGMVWLVVTPNAATLLTTNVEASRLRAEEPLAAEHLDVVTRPWHAADAHVQAAEELAGAPAHEIASDGHESFADADDELTALRLTLTTQEHERLRVLGHDAATVLEDALRTWTPGDRDRDVSAAIAGGLESDGIFPACLIVGGDDRIERFRHPIAVGKPMHRHVMAVVVGERAGLHVALTRFACAEARASQTVIAKCTQAQQIERAMLEACRPGATYGEVLDTADAAYAKIGHAGAWREHYQGGPVGYRQREFEIAPDDRASRWFTQPVEAGQAIAFNPSVAGGGKTEDTFLVTTGGLEPLTDTGRWPTAPVAPGLPARPQILDLSNGDPMPEFARPGAHA